MDEAHLNELGLCCVCGNLAEKKCGSCRIVFYCKKECQKSDWNNGHKNNCQPYKIEEDKITGRYMVATRNLSAGEIILKEDPIVVGPKQITFPICLGCYKRVDGSYRCSGCMWPLCGPQCESEPDHQPECIVGKEIGSPIQISDFDQTSHFYEVVTPLRCLALKKKSPKKYQQLMALESYYEDRKYTEIYNENQKKVVDMIRNYFFIQQFSRDEIDSSEFTIHSITGILDANSVEINMPESDVQALYPKFSMIEHSCISNTRYHFNSKRQLILVAAVNIKKGERLSSMCTHALWGTIARREHIKLNKYFLCQCKRCADPTELGTNFSALRCQNCPYGYLVSAAPLDERADWICNRCNDTENYEIVKSRVYALGERIEAVLETPNIQNLEDIIDASSELVHENHFHLFNAKHALLQMYGRDGNVSDEVMQKKERLCQNVLKLCTTLDPGHCRLIPYISVALYEYHVAIITRSRSLPVNSPGIKKDFESARDLLKQCIKMLKDEPPHTAEDKLRQLAEQNLEELNDIIGCF